MFNIRFSDDDVVGNKIKKSLNPSLYDIVFIKNHLYEINKIESYNDDLYTVELQEYNTLCQTGNIIYTSNYIFKYNNNDKKWKKICMESLYQDINDLNKSIDSIVI